MMLQPGSSLAQSQNTPAAPVASNGPAPTTMEWSATQPDKMTDIAAIQPTLSTQNEEEKMASAIMNAKVTTSSQKQLKFCGPDTIISFSTTVDTETDIDHQIKPLEAGFTISLLKTMIRRAHGIEEILDFQLCCKASRQLISFNDATLPTSLLCFDNEQYIVALLNQRYRADQDIMVSQRPVGGREQPTNLERSIKLDPSLTVLQKEAAIKQMLKTQFPDIVKDKIGGSRYACFSNKCRKTFPHLKPLFEHQKIHLQNYRPFACAHSGCTKSFMSKGHLRNHAETHQMQKNFVCPIQGCNESYSRQQRLKVHLKKHNGNRDFVCPFENCQKAFYEKGNLKTHLRLHTGEKPYHCSALECTKSFATQGHLNDHFLKTHQLGGGIMAAVQDQAQQQALQMLEQQRQNNSSLVIDPLSLALQPSGGEMINTGIVANGVIGAGNVSQEGGYSNNANLSTGFVDASMFTAIQMQMYNQIQLTDINKCNNEGPSGVQGTRPILRQQSAIEELKEEIFHRQANQAIPGPLELQNSMGPIVRAGILQIDLNNAKGNSTVIDKTMGVPNSAASKRKKMLTINIKAANNVADESNFYNQTNSVPKPIDEQSVNMRRDLDESKSMVHENAAGSQVKKDMMTDFMPTFFSFKDYDDKIQQTRGAQTCQKVGNRTLNPPTPIKANPEIQLDSQSLSQNQSQQSKQQMNSLVVTNQTLKQAFGLKPAKSPSEFVPPPAKTPLNPSQLAKRRFFNPPTSVLEQSSEVVMNEIGQNTAGMPGQEIEAQVLKKREVKMEEKIEQSFNKAIRSGLNISHYQSVGLKSVEGCASQQMPQSSVTGSIPTFAPNLNRGSYYTAGGPNKTPTMSQASHVMADLKSLGIGSQQVVAREGNNGAGPDHNMRNSSQLSKQEKASDSSNVLTLRDLKVVSSQEQESQKQKQFAVELKQHEQQLQSSFRNTPQLMDQFGRPALLSQMTYAQATATAIKKPTTTSSFFGQPQQSDIEAAKPFSCQKLPDRHQTAFFNAMVPNSESKQTPQICDQESQEYRKSQNSVSQNALDTLEKQQKQLMSQRMQMMSNNNSSLGSHLQLTPMHSQNLSQTQKSFNFNAQNTSLTVTKPPGQQILESPLISSDSNLPSQAFLNQHQLVQAKGQTTMRNMMTNILQNRSSSGSKGISGGNPRDHNVHNPKISSGLSERSPSSLRWDNKSQQLSVSPISHNLSNPSVFFSHTLNNYGPTSNSGRVFDKGQQGLNTGNINQGQQQQFQFKMPIQQHIQLPQKHQSSLPPLGGGPAGVSNLNIPHPQAQQQSSSPSCLQVSSQRGLINQKGVQTNLSLNHHLDSVLVQVDAQVLNNSSRINNGTNATMNSPAIIGPGMAANQQVPMRNEHSMAAQANNTPAPLAPAGVEEAKLVSAEKNQLSSQIQMMAQGQHRPEQQTLAQLQQAVVESMQSSKEVPKQKEDVVMKSTAAPAQTSTNELPSNNKNEDEVMKMTSSPGPEAKAASISPSKRSSLLTSTFRKEKESPNIGAQSSTFKQQQLDLMKRKCRYQQKLQKIEYQMQIQNQTLQKAMMQAQSENYFFAEPVVPPEHMIKMQTPQQIASNLPLGGMLQGSPWLNSWQQRQQYMMQQAILADKQNQLQQQMQQQFPNIVSPRLEVGPSVNQFLAMPQSTAQEIFEHSASIGQHPNGQAALLNYFSQSPGMNNQPIQSTAAPMASPILRNHMNPGSDPAGIHQMSPHPQSIQQFFAENQFLQQMQQQSARTPQQSQQQAMQLANLLQVPHRNGAQFNDPNFFLSSLSSSSLSGSGGPTGTLQQNLFGQPISGGNSTAGFQQQRVQNAKSSNSSNSLCLNNLIPHQYQLALDQVNAEKQKYQQLQQQHQQQQNQQNADSGSNQQQSDEKQKATSQKHPM